MANPFATNYKEPKKVTKYLKLSDGSNLFRILTPKEQIVTYYAEFEEKAGGGKTKLTYPDLGDAITPESQTKDGVKLYWAMAVFNHDDNCVQVAEFPQKAIKEFIGAIAGSKIKSDWSTFDIEIIKSGQKLETKYVCNSGDKSKLENEAMEICRSEYPKINLKAMESGKDPFEETSQPNAELIEANEPPEIDEQTIDQAVATMGF